MPFTVFFSLPAREEKEEIFYSEGGETLAQVAQSGGRCLETFKARLDGALSDLV